MNDRQINNPDQEARREDEISENKTPDGLYLGDATLQSDREFLQDKKGNHRKEDNTVTASGVDDLQSNSDAAAGTDRAGTAERKDYGDPQLNKGLEEQARDAES